MTFSAWRDLVKAAYQGGAPSSAQLLRCVVDGARSVLVRDVESDLALARSYENSFKAALVKNAGTRITGSDAEVLATASALMPIDDDTVATQAIQSNAILAARDQVNDMATKWDALLLQAAIDLQRHVSCFQVRQITSFLEDSDGLTTSGFVSKVPLPEGGRIQQLTYGRYYAALEIDTTYEVDDKVVSNGRVYKVVTGGSLTIYQIGAGLTSTDGEDETLGDMVFSYYAPERDVPVRQFEWSARELLFAGGYRGGPAYCFPPQAEEIWLYPKLDADHRFDLEWVGVAEEFDDSDEVLFDRTAAEYAAHWIESMMAQSESADGRAAAAALGLAQRALRKAVLDCQERDTGSPTQVQPYDYRRRCWAWGSCCCAPLTYNPGSGGMDINGQISLTNATGNTTVRPTAINFTATITFSGDAGTRLVVLGRGGQGGQSVPRGARLTVQCILPETEGIVLDFRSLLAANPALLPELRFPDGVYTTDGVTTLATFEFYFDGSAWVYEDATIPS